MLNMEVKFARGVWLGVIAAGMAVLPACTKIGSYAEERADIAAYGNIRGAQTAALGGYDPFTINDSQDELIRRMLEMDARREEAEALSLAETIAVAMANSRSYKFRKESLFIQALNLTEVQKDFNFNYNANASAGTSMTTYKDGTSESFGDNGVDANFGAGIRRTLASGAIVSLNVSKNLFNYFTDPDTSGESGVLSFNVVQPLLNGFGPLVTKEPLRQAERDMIYEVRDFKRFQQGFVIDIADQFYSTLQAGDRLVNSRKNYESAVSNRERNDSLAKAGRIPDFQAAQARLSELRAADSWTLARSNYEAALDSFRFTLGLPIELNVIPDTNELRRLELKGLVDLDITLDEALKSAESNRLDLITRREQVEDKERKVEIARRNFLPDLDASYNVSTFEGGNTDVSQSLSVGLNLPFDWTEKRNNFRISQITLAREQRSLEREEDDVKRTVRDLWRKLERNRSVYNNRLLSVKLSERTVEQTSLLLRQGKALTRDLLDAENDLTDARNAATLALVDFTINRMRFWNAIERFEIDPKGMWYELADDQEPVATP